jgi:hypothetical protein
MARLNIKLKDDTLLGVKYRQKCEDKGCPTCGWDGKYVSRATLQFESGNEEFEFISMYGNGVSVGALIKYFCNLDLENVTKQELIKNFKKFIKENER